MKQKDKSLILVAIKGKFTQVVFGPAIPAIVTTKMSELKASGNWDGWRFEARTENGYKIKKILKAA